MILFEFNRWRRAIDLRKRRAAAAIRVVEHTRAQRHIAAQSAYEYYVELAEELDQVEGRA
ncbi:hypothetical protein [Roseibium aggregatum]|uniref:Uncharacterized protein n=1 Tax=Roseibium aggregatum TaxID=187304 RepID=A0A0M6Y7K8_9HYPH|nr:hypothetical protein [Roseibium aggregatum]CTQ45694.1 hypothetical protein LAL4801_04149 [Roseibium aggregatum]